MSLRDDLIAAMRATAAATRELREVKTQSWGTVWMRRPTVAEIDAQDDNPDDSKDGKRLARAAARVICDKEGNLLFNPDNEEDVAILAAQPWDEFSALVNQPKAKAAGN